MLRKILAGLFAILLFFFLALQLVPYGRNHTNPPVVAEPQWDSPQTRAYFFRACADCHSNETVWPWYSNIAPVSWLVQRDVDRGRKAFNVSEWGVNKNSGAEDAAELVQSGEMPLPIYLPLHPEARLSPQEKQEFLQGLVATFGGENSQPSYEAEEEGEE